MREQLIQYVNLLFAGTRGSEDVRQEILQNTLDRYDDLIAEGKSPEAAYRMAIMGIGDIGEILGAQGGAARPQTGPEITKPLDTPGKKVLRAVAVALYIISIMPLLVLSEMGMEIIGLCGTLSIVAVATVLILLASPRKPPNADWQQPQSPRQELYKSIDSLIWAVGIGAYFILSFFTGAWHVTWLVFPITGAVQGLVKAIMQLKEENKP